MNKIWIIIVFCFFCSGLNAQSGLPEITNFTSAQYKAGTQNWMIDQDVDGILYFANNEGLLTFDGTRWQLYPLPNKTHVRSVSIANDGKIYVGGQDEIGYFFPDKNGQLKFHSIKKYIPVNFNQFSDIWDIQIINETVFFRTIDKIFEYHNNKFKIHSAKGEWFISKIIDNALYAQDSHRGLLIYKAGKWEAANLGNDLNDKVVTSILKSNDNKILLSTKKNAFYTLSNKTINKLVSGFDSEYKKSIIGNGVELNDQMFAMSSTAGGCFIINSKGDLITNFTNENGLQKNNIICIFKDRDGNLWLGTEDGIDYIFYNSAISYIFPDKAKQTSVYASIIDNNKLYIGTSNGVFYSAFNASNPNAKNTYDFKKLPTIDGQIWNFNNLNNIVFVSHADGAHSIDGEATKKLFNKGTWLFENMSNEGLNSKVFAGTYHGLHALNFDGSQINKEWDIIGLDESLRFIVYDKVTDLIWASHPYRGVFKIKLSIDRKRIQYRTLYTDNDGLPSTFNNYVFRIKDKVLIATDKGIYEFDATKKKIIKSKFYESIFKDLNIRYLREDYQGNIWFISNKRLGLLYFKNKEFKIIYFPELDSKFLKDFENIYPYNNENIFISANKGVIHLNFEKYKNLSSPLDIRFTEVRTLHNNQILWGGYYSKVKNKFKANLASPFALGYNDNSLHFEFSSNFYNQNKTLMFSYRLIGLDDDWSVWSEKKDIDYTNLPAGNYTFSVKGKNNLGQQTEAINYNFTINSAWYQSWWAYTFYLCFAVGITYIITSYQKKQHLKQQLKLKAKHQIELELNQKQVLKLENDKLISDLDYKNKELTNLSFNLMQRGKLMAKIKGQIIPIFKSVEPINSDDKLKKILKLLSDEERSENEWENFSKNFDTLHFSFLATLKEKIPTLTANELKLCAYLKINLSSKEIAQLLNISLRAVEMSRYRLRKKLSIDTDTNLFDFLIKITTTD